MVFCAHFWRRKRSPKEGTIVCPPNVGPPNSCPLFWAFFLSPEMGPRKTQILNGTVTHNLGARHGDEHEACTHVRFHDVRVCAADLCRCQYLLVTMHAQDVNSRCYVPP